MTRQEQIFTALERIGCKPKYDDKNALFIIFQMKYLHIIIDNEDEDSFVSVIYPQFIEFEEGQETLFLAACNKLTRDSKLAKVYVDHNQISASCEFFYYDTKSLEFCLRKCLRILSVMRTTFSNTLNELDESE